jgi:urease accessory protein
MERNEMSPNIIRLSAVLFALIPSAVLAHVGHADAPSGFAAGFLHPFTGVDHLAAMLAVGIWSAMTTRRIWVAPLSFAGLLLIGALAGIAGVAFPAVEPMIAASLLVIGLLLATQAKLPLAACAALVGAFALFHGAAHGAELAASASVAAALAGMVLGTALIHVAGLALGRYALRRHVLWARAAGGLISVLGVGLLAGMA